MLVPGPMTPFTSHDSAGAVQRDVVVPAGMTLAEVIVTAPSVTPVRLSVAIAEQSICGATAGRSARPLAARAVWAGTATAAAIAIRPIAAALHQRAEKRPTSDCRPAGRRRVAGPTLDVKCTGTVSKGMFLHLVKGRGSAASRTGDLVAQTLGEAGRRSAQPTGRRPW